MKKDVIQSILDNKLIVIVRGIENSKLLPLAQAMYNGGIRLLELTYDSTGNTTDIMTAHNITMLKEYFGDKMHIGAGTVTTPQQAKLTYEAGGSFVISPDTNPEVIKTTIQHDMVSIPGALTPTEIQTAHRWGADFVKLFPVTNMGPDYVKAVKAPLNNIRMLAVGGINLDNIQHYLNCGICGFGIGSNITDKKLISSGNYEGITALAEQYVNAVGR